VTWAKLKFSPQRARWVAAEEWHPQQRRHQDKEGYLVLEVPYSDDRELLMDILKHGHHVKVLEPPALRERVKAELREALARCDGE
jgi:predicted DNA-binding transcriptional regulator YafY